MEYTDVLAELGALAEEKFKAFTSRLLRTRRFVYGVRTPALRRLARRIKAEYPTFTADFFARGEVSHEEILLAGWQTCGSFADNVKLLLGLMRMADSWAQTDQVITDFKWAPDKAALMRELESLLSGGEFEKRAFIVALMTNCMREADFHLIEAYLPRVRFGEYYTDMAAAWLLCEAVVRHPERGRALLNAEFVTPSVRRKALSKMRDSYRIK